MSERVKEIIIPLAICVAIAGVFLGAKSYIDYMDQKNFEHMKEAYEESLEESIDYVERITAFSTLTELKGMIREISFLSHKGVSQEILRKELENLCSLSYSSNEYLKEVVLVPPNTSDVEDICRDIVSQIDDHIHKIEIEIEVEYGKKDE